MATSALDSNLAPRAPANAKERGSQRIARAEQLPFDLSDIAVRTGANRDAQRSANREVASNLVRTGFDRAVALWCRARGGVSARLYAECIGRDEEALAAMRTGKGEITAADLAPCFGSPESAIEIMQAMLRPTRASVRIRARPTAPTAPDKWTVTRALARHFDRAITIWIAKQDNGQGKAGNFAALIGVTPSVLSEMRSGSGTPRTIGPEHVLPLLGIREAAAEITRGYMEAAGCEVEIVGLETLRAATVVRDILAWVLGDPSRRRHFIRDEAEDQGHRPEDIERAIRDIEGIGDGDDDADGDRPFDAMPAEYRQ